MAAGRELLQGKHLVISCTLNDVSSEIQSYSLIDCGATGIAFIDEDFASRLSFPLYQLKQPREIEVMDGRPIASGSVTYLTKLLVVINGHKEMLPFFVTKVGHYPLVFGIPWLRLHNVSI